MDPPSSDIVKTIARDFRDYSTLHGCTVSESTSSDALLCRRYASFVADDSWLLLIILSHSTIFRHAALTLYPKSWDLFTACLKQNAVSLEVFAKVRGLKTQYSVQRITNNVPSAMQLNMRRIQGRILRTKPGSVHGYVVAESMELVRHPTFEGYTQIDINSNIYKPEYYEAMKPRHWPKGKAWPSDPTLRIRGEGTCGSCGNEKMCHCDPISCPEVSNPLVEIRDFGHKGRGIRTLQRHRRGDLLAEYVGLIKPLDYDDDPVYGFIFTPYGKPDDDLGTISAKKFGNWTRFINHSCRPSTRFKEIVIGNRIRNMVVTLRDIDIFEELTINYGKDYWRECFCECGESCCKLSHRYAIDHKDSGRGHIKARVF